MEFENVADEYKEKIKTLIPSMDKEITETPTIVFADILNGFVAYCSENEYLKYLFERPEGVDKAVYLSKVPNGVEAFEQWVNTGFSGFAENILTSLKEFIPSDIGFIYFAQFLDDHNYENYFNNSKIPPELHDEIKSSFEELTSEPWLTLFSQAIGCASIGLFNSSISLITLCIQKLIYEDDDIYKIISDAKRIEIENRKATKDSLASNNIKHDKSRVIEEYTIQKFVSLPEHLTLKPIDVINSIVDDVIDFSLTSEDVENASGYFKFYDEIKYKDRPLERPRENIRKWIRKYKKSLEITN